ncbi:hypothetical protein NLU14_11540 [Marinobacter sp. 71-i]|uniref:Uncharacterized protein n=1 Tax=Marinobacter iranensis TaxID=2962607 RepID=A0ABT5YB02_9GAMM|nr:hypothetical protein [Marinobacter iranensis]MDF0750858.1 hypothetical protein [Marinobacter iranensis]
MAAHSSFTSGQIDQIVRMVDTWLGKLTWALLVERIATELELQTTRQTLDKYPSIKRAYKRAKARLRVEGPLEAKFVNFTQQDLDSFKRIESLEKEVDSWKRQARVLQEFLNKLMKASSSNKALLDTLESLAKQHRKQEHQRHG